MNNRAVMRSQNFKAESRSIIIVAVTWAMRIFVGGLFIFSGFTKGIDVWGTIYKFNDYFNVWGLEIWDSVNLVGVFLLCLAEFLTGFCLLFGCFRRGAPFMALLIMAFMLPLTLWLAVKNPVSDCGCFGDAVKLTNWETFYKNVALTAGAVWLVVYNSKAVCLINPYLQWIAVLATSLYLVSIAWLGYYYQPLIDFRPYKVGTELTATDESDNFDSGEDEYLRFVYERNGERKTFSIEDELPDEEDGWVFVERFYDIPEGEEIVVPQPDLSKKHDKNLRLFTEDGREDVTEEAVGDGRQLILMIPNLSEVTAAKTWKINSLFDWCEANGIEMLAAVGGNPYEIALWKDLSLAEYPIYTSDDTSIEEVVRGNPGVVYVEDGVIRWKSSLKAIDIDDFRDEALDSDPMVFSRDNRRILLTLTWIYVGFTLLLIFLTFSPKLLQTILNHDKRHEKKNAGRMGESQDDSDGLSQ